MPAKTNSLDKAPYTKNGSLLHWVPRDHNVWYPNDPFHAALKVQGMKSGYSAKYLILSSPNSEDTREFPMFVTDLADAVANIPEIRNGIMVARWIVRKRGANYGVALAPGVTAPYATGGEQ
jgi:hypothetical protein